MKQPIFSLKPKKHWWQKDKIILERDFTIEVGGYTFTLKAGFDSDGASLPRTLWWVSNPFDSQTIAGSLVHDAVYWTRVFDRKTADKMFLIINLEQNCPPNKATLFYRAVRLGGWWGYYITPLWEGRPSEEEIAKYLQIKYNK